MFRGIPAGLVRQAIVLQAAALRDRALEVYTSDDVYRAALLLGVGLLGTALSEGILPSHAIPSGDFTVLLYG